jgi:4-hydroxy-tetrahydrodipicolinate reductase
VRLLLNGRSGKVGSVLGPALEAAGHELVDDLAAADAMVDFTAPDAVVVNVGAALAAGVPCVVGTSGADLKDVGEKAREVGVPVLYAPNFALGAVLMIRFAAEAAKHLPRAEIVEAHNEAKKDAPSGTAKATAEAMGGDVTIHSVRLPGLVAHQEVLLAGEGQLLTIRHDAFSREAYAPGVLLALERLNSLPAGLTIGLDALLG